MKSKNKGINNNNNCNNQQSNSLNINKIINYQLSKSDTKEQNEKCNKSFSFYIIEILVSISISKLKIYK